MPRVADLIVLAAPSCCGKTRFLDQVCDGAHEDFLLRMGITEPIDSYMQVASLKEADALRDANVARMIFHFTIPSIPLIERRLGRLSDEPRLGFVRAAEKVTAITLLASGDALASRLQLRNRTTRKLICKSIPKYLAVRRKLGKLQHIYDNPANLVAVYEEWFGYMQSLPNLAQSWLVTAEDDYALYAPTEWHHFRSSYFPGARVLG